MSLPARIYQGDGEWLIRPDEADAIGDTVRVDGVVEPVTVLERTSEWVLVRVGVDGSLYRRDADRNLRVGLVTTA